jgi:uncharacterized membrane protein YhhN
LEFFTPSIHLYQLLAAAVLVLHFAFIAFVLGGGLLVLRWPRLAWLHGPAVVWGVAIEFMGWVCPLTPLENRFLTLAGDVPYSGDFIERYLLSIIYPVGLTPRAQMVLAGVVLVLNGMIYAEMMRARGRRPKP